MGVQSEQLLEEVDDVFLPDCALLDGPGNEPVIFRSMDANPRRRFSRQWETLVTHLGGNIQLKDIAVSRRLCDVGQRLQSQHTGPVPQGFTVPQAGGEQQIVECRECGDYSKRNTATLPASRFKGDFHADSTLKLTRLLPSCCFSCEKIGVFCTLVLSTCNFLCLA